MARRESLAEYQNDLLQKMELARLASAADTSLFFGFVSNGQHYLIDGRFVVEVTDASVIQPIPVAKPWAIGAANIKGSVYTITDFSLLLGGRRIRKGKFLVLSEDVVSGSALLIESLSNLYEKDAIGQPLNTSPEMAKQPSWVTACHQIGGHKYFMIDGARLTADPKFSNLQSGDNS